jgi:hypothetical protein
MTERRYNDAEVQKILEAGAKLSTPQSRGAEQGLTLSEIQDIAREVGLSPDAIHQAAAALETREIAAPRQSLGMPIEVGKSVRLPTAPTDAEWERIVVEIRAAFSTHGRVSSSGSLREWRNGNLHVCVEPVADGYRLRMGTLKSDAAGLNAVGAVGVVGAVAFFMSTMHGGAPDTTIFGTALLGGTGLAAFLGNAIRLPRWADRRGKQMDQIAARALEIVTPAPAIGAGSSDR